MVLADYRGPMPLEHLQESRLGKNHALNTGLTAAEGDLVVLTDDDVFSSIIVNSPLTCSDSP